MIPSLQSAGTPPVLQTDRKIKWSALDTGKMEWLRQQSTTGNSAISAKTGNTYVSSTVPDNVETPTTNSAFLTTTSSVTKCVGNQRRTTGN